MAGWTRVIGDLFLGERSVTSCICSLFGRYPLESHPLHSRPVSVTHRPCQCLSSPVTDVARYRALETNSPLWCFQPRRHIVFRLVSSGHTPVDSAVSGTNEGPLNDALGQGM